MDPILFQYVFAILRQILKKLHLILAGTILASFVGLVMGMLYQPKFQTSITIFADNQNVIRPLLEGGAAVTVPKSERVRIVQETMFSPRMLEQVVKGSFGPELLPGSDQMESAMKELRDRIKLSAPANNYINIAYAHEDPRVSYQVVNRTTNLFIEESAKNKRSESRSAYTFIDEQVKSYKDQLVDAENKLKTFEAANVDGVESQVNNSITRLRATIDEISIDIEAEEVRIAAIEGQLASESRFASSDYNARVYRDRLALLESQLDTLLLNYREEHPDVVDLNIQIQDVRRTIVEVENKNQASDSRVDDANSEMRLNPIYEQLSNQLAEARVNVQTMKHRLKANQNRLQNQFERRVRVASNQAQLSELTRDYSVTRGIYEDLLERKERARISMTLDLAGQGVSYKILEPAVFPILPTGLRFLHFIIAGPIIGFILSAAFCVITVVLDQRIKFAGQVNNMYPGIVLAEIPAPAIKYQNWKTLGSVVAAFLIVYIGTAISYQYI